MKKISILAMLLSLSFCFSACAVSLGESSSNGKESYSSVIDGEEADSSLQESANESVKEDEEKTYYTVTFDTDRGGEVDPVTVLHGQKLTKPDDPVKITQNCEYIFEGWFWNGEEWNFEEDAVTQDMTLVAHWKEGESYTKPFLPKN